MRRTILLAVVVCVSAAMSTPQAQNQTTGTGDAQKGKTAFVNLGCFTCHGTVGQGGAGARLAPKPLPLQSFSAYVRSGRRGWSIAGGMPGYPVKVVSEQAMLDIWTYLSSIQPPPAASSIAILKD
jgi:ubiquinol-cytochrome c reductase cytochrome c subunit